MLRKRIIPCLDVRDGRTTKGVRFQNNVDIGDPVAMARYYYEEGADELVFYDITASAEGRGIMLDVVRRVAAEIFIPFAVGGGLGTLDELRQVLLAGAEKVSVNSGAVRNPDLIRQGAEAFGKQCIVLGMDAKWVGVSPPLPSGYEVVTHGGRRATGMDALKWAQQAEAMGAGEICLNSIDADGTQEGYEIRLTSLISTHVEIPVIASGGAGRPEHLTAVLREGCADAALIASMVHFGGYRIADLKRHLHEAGIPVRMTW
ncbi:MAG: imidazole glycerol phosphate synthase subunit HisF [Lentisphaerae bacterium RIFOXYA12_64_32]|nr:MAG: imidazole glycerol phosphate synthase subunit HisF [Lentisphaerae bacterium RIFOXYA12_64_32]